MDGRVKQFELALYGFFRQFHEASLPDRSGIYFVFCGISKEEGRCSIKRLIYIGESGSIQNRLSAHEKKDRFENSLQDGERLYYAYTLVPTSERELCEKGLIRHFAERFPDTLINKKSTKSFSSGFDFLQYVLTRKVPQFFTAEDRSFFVCTGET